MSEGQAPESQPKIKFSTPEEIDGRDRERLIEEILNGTNEQQKRDRIQYLVNWELAQTLLQVKAELAKGQPSLQEFLDKLGTPKVLNSIGSRSNNASTNNSNNPMHDFYKPSVKNQ